MYLCTRFRQGNGAEERREEVEGERDLKQLKQEIACVPVAGQGPVGGRGESKVTKQFLQ